MKIHIENIDAFIFDFDGVLTNNLVHLDQDGKEWVSCSRSDGLAFDVIRKLNKAAYILSTEENKVVSARALKLKIRAIQGIKNKADELTFLADSMGFDLERVIYVGNDLNDFHAMSICGYTACPIDSHHKIKELSDIILSSSGGNGVVRELLENNFDLDFVKILY
jgi:3-deoxy-D-manno-octulosonate 8-phosphate phosphatase (KDO 8-P phosphatase)